MQEAKQFVEVLYESTEDLQSIFLQFEEVSLMSMGEILMYHPVEYDVATRKKAFSVMMRLLKCDPVDVKKRWGLLLDAVYVSFLSPDYDDLNTDLREGYQFIIEEIEKTVSERSFVLDDERQSDSNERQDAPVVIVTSQFLKTSHAPTRRVLDYAYTIKTRLHVPVVIVNDSCMNGENHWVSFNYADVYNEMKEYQYKDEAFPFLQIPKIMPDIDEIIKVLSYIRNLKPRLVYNVSGYSIVADLCRAFAKTASIPCAIDFPVSMAEYMVLPRGLRETDEKTIKTFKSWQKPVISRYNYIYPRGDSDDYKRTDYGINEEDFVLAVVGNRLETEMRDEFLMVIRDILNKFKNACVLFIGNIDDKERIAGIIEENKRLVFAGNVSNGGECVKMADLYIQPTRAGGGRSAFEAAYHGLPVVTVRYGDVWGTMGDEFTVEDYDGMREKISEYINDKTYYDVMSKKAKQRADELEDMEGTFVDLFEKLDVKY